MAATKGKDVRETLIRGRSSSEGEDEGIGPESALDYECQRANGPVRQTTFVCGGSKVVAGMVQEQNGVEAWKILTKRDIENRHRSTRILGSFFKRTMTRTNEGTGPLNLGKLRHE